MPSFEHLFQAARGQPVSYQGRTIVMLDHFPTLQSRRVRLVYESIGSKWRQGARLKLDGACKINDPIIQRRTGIVLWYDTAPTTVTVELVDLGITVVTVNNVWDVGDGVVHAWHNGAAMIVDEIPNGRRYRCNDGFPDDDFDDIVFRIERVAAE
ncbi:MAG: hypothetical protein CHACPFDD_01254 [Phycisphaerae bacterium]|nr:hypothetical protein [Phycisphaerae bacterium]